MPQTVISIRPFGNSSHVCLLTRAVGDLGGSGDEVSPFECGPDHEPFLVLARVPLPPDGVANAGRELMLRLSENPAVRRALELAQALGGQGPSPIYVDARSTAGQALPWEALCGDNGEFFALNDNWPVGRLSGSVTSTEGVERSFDPPLRVLAVIGAAGVDGEPEYGRLRAALRRRQLSLGFRLHVLLCEDSVTQAIIDDADGEVTHEYLIDADQLSRTVEEFRPHVLHFFCHGQAGANPSLELTTRRDKTLNRDRGSILLEEADFRSLLRAHPSLWILVLNCCLGAAVSEETRSLASRLVLMGYPAVVGMGEPVASDDANLFCGTFYEALTTLLDRCLGADTEEQTIEWVEAMSAPRRALCKQHAQRISKAGDVKEWTLPMLYVQPGSFRLIGPFVAPGLGPERVAALQSEIQKLAELRAELAALPELPVEALAKIDARIHARRAELFPSREDAAAPAAQTFEAEG